MSKNVISILQLIREQQNISRAEIAGLTGLSRPAVSAIVEKALASGMISETGIGESNGGKPPVMLSIVSEFCGALGLDLGEENLIRGMVCDAGGAIVAEGAEQYDNQFDSILAAAALLVEKLKKQSGKLALRGIGVAVSGIVDDNTNEVVESSNFDIIGKKMSDKLQTSCQMPVFLSNRARTAAHAEKVGGNASDCADFIYLSIGKSIGCGIYRDGGLFRGSFNGAGEISTLLVPDENGNKRLEEVITESYLCNAFERLARRKYDWDELCRAWHDGHPDACKVFEKNSEHVAYAAAVAANLLNPQRIILGGRFKELGDPYLEIFRRHFTSGLTAPFRDRIDVRLSRFGRKATAYGAALKVIDKVFRFEL